MIEVQRTLEGRRGAVLRLLRPRPYLQAFRELTSLFRESRTLTLEMAMREIRAAHAGQTLGVFWGIAQPLFLMLLYAFLFGVVFRQKIGGTYELPRNFIVYLLAGLVPWLAFQVSMLKSSTVISGNANLVKQVVFKLEVLPAAGVLAACLSLAIGLTFMTLYTLVVYAALPLTYLLLPALVILQILAMGGVSFALAALGAFFRDVKMIPLTFGLVF